MKVALFRCEGSYCFSVDVCECVYVVDVTLCFFLVNVFERFANVNLKPLIRPDGVEKERKKKMVSFSWVCFSRFEWSQKEKKNLLLCALEVETRLQNNVFSRYR